MSLETAVKNYANELNQSFDAGSNSHVTLRRIYNQYGEEETNNALDAYFKAEKGKPRRRSIRVIFEDGNIIKTEINGTEEQIKEYYIGKYFNFGIDGDDIQKAISLTFID